jgi:hypothetical protein
VATDKDYLLKNKVYDLLKKFTTLILPAFGALYFGLAAIWGLPAAEQVVGTCAVVATFLGVIIKLGDNSYNASEDRFDGDINIVDKKDGELYDMVLKVPAEELKGMSEITFKVTDQTTT